MTSSRPSDTARVLTLVGAGVVALVSTALLAVGALSLWGNAQKDDAGYLSTGRGDVTTRSYALATEDMDIDLDGAGDLLDNSELGKVRVSAESNAGKPVFVGVAHTRDVERYLAGTAHATVTDFDSSPFTVTKDEQPGRRAPAAPTDTSIWSASTHGTGTQRLEWKVADGNWSIVVMNADGSRGVDAKVSAGAKAPFLAPLGWASLAGGLVLLVAAGGLVYLGVRPPRVPPAPPVEATHVAA
jgi:hypothetical protein